MKKRVLKGIIGLVLSLCILGSECISVVAATTEEETTSSADTIPSSYDARDYGYVSDGRSQYAGTCWAFASIAAAESSLIKSGLANDDIDLSEFHVVYYAFMDTYTDPLGNTDGDNGMVTSIYNAINNGGQDCYVAEQFAKWSGPVLEEDMPYSNSEYLQGTYPEITEDLSTESLYHLNKAIYENGNRTEIKKLIMKYGSVTGAFYVGSSSYMNYKDYDEVTYHIPNAQISNHSISIIGWDDNYPKENFNYQPENDGAWLVKDHKKNNEWWWISYETYMSSITAYEFEAADLLENNYQYDGHPIENRTFNAITASSRPQVSKVMNVFEAKKSQNTLEKLEAVMIHATKNTTSEITIYVNPILKDGQLVSYEYKSDMIEFCPEYSGIYKVDVPETIYLNEGDTFGIEISGETASSYPISTSSRYGTEAVHPGESYVGKTEYDEFSYVDLADYNNSGNLRIKGFTNSTDIPLAGDVTIDKTAETLQAGDAFTIHGSVSVPAGALAGITYTSNNPSVATVDAKGNVTALKVGTATITAAATYGSDRKECTVTVEPTLATSLTVEGNVSLKESNYYQLNAVVDDAATDKSVSYESSDTSIVTVDENGELYGIWQGRATITVRTTDGSNLTATCNVTVKSLSDDDTDTGAGTTGGTANDTTTGALTQSVVLNVSSNSIPVGGTAQLNVNVNPAENLSKLEYYVTDTSVISLNGTTITGLKPGTAVITVIAPDSGAYGTVTIQVTNVNITTSPTPSTPKQNIKVGTVFTYSGLRYKVTASNTVKVIGANKSSVKSVTIPATVKYRGKTFKVTEIGSKAFSGYKKLKSVTIGTNVKKINSKAFYNCKKLQTISVKSKIIKSVGKNAFKGTSGKVKITVPKSKYKAYKKTFQNAGFGNGVKWKKK